MVAIFGGFKAEFSGRAVFYHRLEKQSPTDRCTGSTGLGCVRASLGGKMLVSLRRLSSDTAEVAIICLS
jgi:hypothetical protein